MTTPRTKGRERLTLALGLAFSTLALYLFLRRVDPPELWASMRSANLWILLLCPVFRGAVLALNAIRTGVLLRPVRRYTFPETFVPWLTGFVTDNLFPFRLGELVRIDLLARAGDVSRGSTVAVVALDRLVDLASFLLLLLVAAPLLALDIGHDRRLVLAMVVAFGGLLFTSWLAMNPTRLTSVVLVLTRPLGERSRHWISDKAQRFTDGLGALRSRRLVLSVVALTLLARLLGLATIQCWLTAFGLELPFYAPLVVLLFLTVGIMIPSSPGFVGTFHVATAYALELMGVAPSAAASVAIAGHFLATVPWTAIGLGVCFRSVRRLWRENRNPVGPSEPVFGA